MYEKPNLLLSVMWIGAVLFGGVWLEIFFSGAVWPAPFFLPTVFYLMLIFGWCFVLWPAVAAGLMLDTALGRPFFAAATATAMIALYCWRRPGRKGWDRYLALAFPCLIIGLSYGVLVTAGESVGLSYWGGLLHALPRGILRAGITAAAAGPLIMRLLDEAAVRAELPGLVANRPELYFE